MVNYWYFKIRANNDSEEFERELEYVKDTNSIGIGYDLQIEYKPSEVEERRNHWLSNNISNNQIKKRESYFQTFTQKMKKGDIVFLCQGENKILYICELADNEYYYLDNEPFYFRHRRRITNIKPFECAVPTKKALRQTIHYV